MEKRKKKYEYVRKTQRYNGKKYEATGKTEKEALRKLADKIAAAKRGEAESGGNMTVDAWFKLWLETYKAPKGLTKKSLAMYDEKYRNYVKPEIGSMRLKDVRDVHLQAILNGQAGKSESHVSKLRMVMQSLFKRARQSRMIMYDPAELLEMPRVTEGRRRPLTAAEREAFLFAARDHPWGLWILTLLYTGIRPGESAALRWGDVDFERGEIRIRQARESGRKTLKKTKTEAGLRDIPMRRELRELLQKARDAALAEWRAASKPGPQAGSRKRKRTEAALSEQAQAGTLPEAAFLETYVFPGPRGGVADDSALRRWWLSFVRAADIANGAEVYRNKIIKSTFAPDLKLYCLRHTFATDLQRAGVALNVAKELLGHSDITVTANVYTHKDNEVLHEGIAALDAWEEARKDGGEK